ncbi:MAG: PQQ-dependent sugar dehydrogenase [Asticcacaulis sp.]
MNRRKLMLACAALTSVTALPACAQNTGGKPYTTKVHAKGLEQPWGMAFLPDGRLLVTEKSGRLRIVSADGRMMQTIGGVPKVVDIGQGGLLDVVVDPAFTKNGFIYLSYSEADSTGKSGTAVARAKLEGHSLLGLKVIWQQTPKVNSPNHWGSRLAFAKDGNLFITTGDRASFRNLAQDLSTTVGKVVRIRPDGSIPADNPFAKQAGAKPEIWSYGHRNVQGAAIHPQTGQLWTNEHGPQGGDEINITQAGKNYGWPVITYGEEYGGGKIGVTQKAGLEQPLHYWVPSIAPSDMLFYIGKHKVWQNKLFIGSLKFQYLNMITLTNGKVTKQEKLLEEFNERVRAVAQGPDGALYVAFDSVDGRIIRVQPK